MNKQRHDGRNNNQLRPIKTTSGLYEYAAGSVLFECGRTKVLCAVTLQNGVPSFLKGKGTGWLTAEYSLLPTSTQIRTQRENSMMHKNGRSVEISRFIGRCFRSIVDLSVIGERTIVIDCDVLQADGGTRTTAITGSLLALRQAQDVWLTSKIIKSPVIRDAIVAVSVGIAQGQVLLDLDYQEDSVASADFNFVITESDNIIEVQGGAESSPVSWNQFDQLKMLARKGATELFALYQESKNESVEPAQRAPFFSLKNRQQSS